MFLFCLVSLRWVLVAARGIFFWFPEDDQISLVDVGADKVAERLRNLDLNTITPIEAMNLLAELQKTANA